MGRKFYPTQTQPLEIYPKPYDQFELCLKRASWYSKVWNESQNDPRHRRNLRPKLSPLYLLAFFSFLASFSCLSLSVFASDGVSMSSKSYTVTFKAISPVCLPLQTQNVLLCCSGVIGP